MSMDTGILNNAVDPDRNSFQFSMCFGTVKTLLRNCTFLNRSTNKIEK